MSVSSRNRSAKILRVAARVAGVGITIPYLALMIIGMNLGEQSNAMPGIMGGVLALATCALSWWRVGLAGILLVLISIGMGVFVRFDSPGELLGWGIVLLPWLVSGILFLSSWWLSRKTNSSGLPPPPSS